MLSCAYVLRPRSAAPRTFIPGYDTPLPASRKKAGSGHVAGYVPIATGNGGVSPAERCRLVGDGYIAVLMSTLVPFHKLLIASAIVFCAGFSAWQLLRFTRSGGTLDLILGLAFALAAGLLIVYLMHLRRILNLPKSRRPD